VAVQLQDWAFTKNTLGVSSLPGKFIDYVII
jgi:hypothetical protein